MVVPRAPADDPNNKNRAGPRAAKPNTDCDDRLGFVGFGYQGRGKCLDRTWRALSSLDSTR